MMRISDEVKNTLVFIGIALLLMVMFVGVIYITF